MAEGWLKHSARQQFPNLEIWSAATEQTILNPNAVLMMREVSVDINHTSNAYDVPIPWKFDVILTVRNTANEIYLAFPDKTVRLQLLTPDPLGTTLEVWRDVRNLFKYITKSLVVGHEKNHLPSDNDLKLVQFA
jgi:arsenate reductase